nr:MFS transporter [Armatimonadota bacterium]
MTTAPVPGSPAPNKTGGDAPSAEDRSAQPSPWRPLHYELFRVLWIASVASNVGTWMHSVGVVWMMTTLSRSPTMVALVQTAGSLPLFFLAFPAGALADIIDRRKLLLFSQAWMLAAAGALGLLTFLGLVGPWSLLTFTFLLGVGSAMNGPAWQAIMPELVDRPDLAAAVTLNGVGMNLARAVGPALGGLIVALAGAG